MRFFALFFLFYTNVILAEPFMPLFLPKARKTGWSGLEWFSSFEVLSSFFFFLLAIGLVPTKIRNSKNKNNCMYYINKWVVQTPISFFF